MKENPYWIEDVLEIEKRNNSHIYLYVDDCNPYECSWMVIENSAYHLQTLISHLKITYEYWASAHQVVAIIRNIQLADVIHFFPSPPICFNEYIMI